MKNKALRVVFRLVGDARTVQYFPILIKPPKIHWKAMS